MTAICRFRLLLSILAVTLPGQLPGAESDTVNERIPVRKSEMEAHWQVDCAASWRKLVSQVGTAACEPRAELQQQLKLCAYIYQPPGSKPAYHCPDYRGAIIQLETPGRDDLCPRLSSFLQQQESCPPPPTENP